MGQVLAKTEPVQLVAHKLPRADAGGQIPDADLVDQGKEHGFTGHRHNNTGTNNLGLIYMNARYYMPEIGRFISPDTIVPDPANPQSYNRYAYVRNNPMNFTDPTGHRECGASDGCQNPLPRAPQGQLEVLVTPIDECDPVASLCDVSANQPGFWVLQGDITEACGMGHCPEEHQWVYFGIPYTVGQRRSLVQREARELCYEFGNCATAEVSLILGVITFPMASIGAIPSIILDVISVDAENGTPETVLGLTIDLAELSDIGGLVASILGSGIDVWGAVDAASQWELEAERNVDIRVAHQLRWLRYYGSAFGDINHD